MGDLLDEVVDKARRDRKVAKMLREIAKLDSKLMPTGTPVVIEDEYQRMQSPKSQQMGVKLSNLCDEVAEKIAGPSEDVDELAMWISYHCQEVTRELNKK